MIRFKSDKINPAGIRPELLLAVVVAEGVYRDCGVDLVITSLCDSTHSTTSLHYAGCAVDIRVSSLPPPARKAAAKKIKSCLNVHYDVILEKDHIHLEYQPRKP